MTLTNQNAFMQTADEHVQKYRAISKGKKQVFIVDDDKSVLRALKILMLAYGYIVRTFSCAEEFFSAIPNDSPGCLILDIQLPGINGLEAQQHLFKSGSNRPVIIITADKSDDLQERSIKTGAKGFLQKPINDLDLVNLINQSSIN